MSLLNEADFRALAPRVAEIAHRAGNAILQVYGDDFDVERKQDNSPVTEADLASHDLIVAALTELTPGIPVLSEEDSNIPFEQRRGWEQYWLVDPLDGTKEFVSRNGEFTVNIALISGHAPALGVVQVPVSGDCYVGVVGQGATLLRGGKSPQPIHVRIPRSRPVVVVGSRSHANPRLAEHLEALGDYELVTMGSSLKCCLVAEGKADFYPRLGPTFEWDTASAHAVVVAAGG
ncbi:MAG: 3'(2'),5'-bisphosphate nucleotidase CysQ, partial [Xanthomonadales bacterium]|nr:3'(2'),5'-bisphosphate nucleotidase CysQ [Xanthomonadales bacterium]